MGFGFVSFGVKRKSPSAAVSRSVNLLFYEPRTKANVCIKTHFKEISRCLVRYEGKLNEICFPEKPDFLDTSSAPN